MDLHDYVRLFRKHVRTIAAVFVVTVIVAAGYAVRAPKLYRANIRLFVTAQSHTTAGNAEFFQDDAYSNSLLAVERVKSYAALISGPRVGDEVAKRLKYVDVTGKPVKPSISASAPMDTVLIDVSAVDTDPVRAQGTANMAGEVIVELVESIERPPSGTAQSTLRVTVVESAKLPQAPFAPRKKLIVLMGAFFGLVVGVGLAALREKLDTSIKNPEDLATATDAPVVGVIGYDSRTPRRPLVVHMDTRSPSAEAFRQLRTNIRFVNIDHTVRSLVVTSAVSNEGKSTISCNLAIALAQAGQRVVLVEADLRKPSVRQYMGVEGAVGLTNVLLGEVELEDVLQPWGGGLLDVLPGGAIAPNPSELLGSAGMSELIARLEAMSDLVIFDAPPLLPVTDAAVLGVNTDGAVLVVRSGATSRERVDRAVESLGGVGVRIVGSVLNMAPTKGPDAYHYYSYYGREVSQRGLLARFRGKPAPGNVSAGGPTAAPKRRSTVGSGKR